MPHYVNIALGNFLWQVFLLFGVGAALYFFFYRICLLMGWVLWSRLFFFSIEKRKSNVLHARWHKKHDIKNCRREGERRGKKYRASFEGREAGIFCPGGWMWLPEGRDR